MQSLPTNTCEAWPQSILVGLALSLSVTETLTKHLTAKTRCTIEYRRVYKHHICTREVINLIDASIVREEVSDGLLAYTTL